MAEEAEVPVIPEEEGGSKMSVQADLDESMRHMDEVDEMVKKRSTVQSDKAKSLENEPDAKRSMTRKSKRLTSSLRKRSEVDDDVVVLPPECNEDDEDAKRAHGDVMRNKMSIPWFQEISLTEEQCQGICFSESLLMVDEVGNTSGKMYATVKMAKWGEDDCLCVHAGCYGVPDVGLECGTTITGFVSLDMKPLQEFVQEWAICDGKTTQRKTLIVKDGSEMHVEITKYEDDKVMEQIVVNLTEAQQELLVTEAPNIALLRHVMLDKRALGEMELKTLIFTGKVVKNLYTAKGNSWENVRGEEIRAWTIRRQVNFDFGERYWDSLLNLYGRLILRCQPKNIHALIPLWFEPAKDENGKIQCYPTYIWACDADLYAKYLIRKDKLAADNRSYLLGHPELRSLLSDFLQAVLLRKPHNVVSFASQFFECFLHYKMKSASFELSSSSSSSGSSIAYSEDWGLGEGGGEDFDIAKFLYKDEPMRDYEGFQMVSTGGEEDELHHHHHHQHHEKPKSLTPPEVNGESEAATVKEPKSSENDNEKEPFPVDVEEQNEEIPESEVAEDDQQQENDDESNILKELNG